MIPLNFILIDLDSLIIQVKIRWIAVIVDYGGIRRRVSSAVQQCLTSWTYWTHLDQSEGFKLERILIVKALTRVLDFPVGTTSNDFVEERKYSWKREHGLNRCSWKIR